MGVIDAILHNYRRIVPMLCSSRGNHSLQSVIDGYNEVQMRKIKMCAKQMAYQCKH